MIVVEYDSDLCRWATDGAHRPDGKPILTVKQMRHAADRYRLGKSRSGKCIYWMIDELGRMQEGRLGEAWVSVLLKTREPMLRKYWRESICLFGQHLLMEEESFGLPVSIVDTERSAVILSELFPESLWMAIPTTMFQIDLLEPLKGRRIRLFPRADVTSSNYVCFLDLAEMARRTYHLDITVSDVLEANASEEQRQQEVDLLEFLLSWSVECGV